MKRKFNLPIETSKTSPQKINQGRSSVELFLCRNIKLTLETWPLIQTDLNNKTVRVTLHGEVANNSVGIILKLLSSKRILRSV